MSPLLRTFNFSQKPTCIRWPLLHALRTYASQPSKRKLLSFEDIGLDRATTLNVQEAFSNIQHPTPAQAEYIPAILNGKDVVLRGQTGSGKSFGLLLALLSLERKRAKAFQTAGDATKKQQPTTLIITPHRELAHQFSHWLHTLITANPDQVPFNKVAQVLVRGAATPLPLHLSHLRADPPRILIATPQALLEAVSLKHLPLSLHGLRTVVVDEADYLLEAAAKPDNASRWKKKPRHAPPTRHILDYIYGSRSQTAKEGTVVLTGEPVRPRPQLILAGATLSAHWRHSVMNDGWLTSVPGDLVKVAPSDFLNVTGHEARAPSAITHCALVVADDGRTTNIAGAVDPPAVADEDEVSSSPTSEHGDALTADRSLDMHSAVESLGAHHLAEFAKRPSPFNQAALEAIGIVFALEVPRVALLVLPAEASVSRAVFDLRTLGVNAHGVDVLKGVQGGAYLLRRDSQEEDNPALLVSTQATTRGLDMPDLTHVFLLDISREMSADTYLHIAGRVGRFGRAGKVVSILEQPRRVVSGKTRDGEPRTVQKNEARWLEKIYREIKVRPTKLEHFDVEEIAADCVDDAAHERGPEKKPQDSH